ncbi:hypothetical protein H9M94_01680 [Mycoplasma sp. Pen4]|uniref:hypothetical protein n=1 Tax=Mycoplasma sp. Pen4 TaxID=640330 RepID=UPI0016544DE0|nr:hypothetical protein [Mycoplasma sp. Pen4]QNM93323.1 hypothetical protein H9M94_01680 [Mycoplasma sp. Pen4]
MELEKELKDELKTFIKHFKINMNENAVFEAIENNIDTSDRKLLLNVLSFFKSNFKGHSNENIANLLWPSINNPEKLREIYQEIWKYSIFLKKQDDDWKLAYLENKAQDISERVFTFDELQSLINIDLKEKGLESQYINLVSEIKDLSTNDFLSINDSINKIEIINSKKLDELFKEKLNEITEDYIISILDRKKWVKQV